MDRSHDDGCYENAAPNVHIARSAFDLGLLLDHANVKELMLLPTMSFCTLTTALSVAALRIATGGVI